MARIRSIRPEILDDEKVAELPHLTWRLFVSLITMADDYGNLHGAPGKIRGTALWATDVADSEVRESLARLSRDSLVTLYTVRGQSYVHLTGWAKHQKVDKPGRPIVPGPEQADSDTCEHSRESRETPANPRESLATDMDMDMEGDKEGEREGGPATPAPPALVLVAPEPPEPRMPDAVDRLWAEQENHRAALGGRPLTLTKDRRKLVRAAISAGYSSDDLLTTVKAYAAEAKASGSLEWFNGETNWRPANIARKLGGISSNARPAAPARGGGGFGAPVQQRRVPIRDLDAPVRRSDP